MENEELIKLAIEARKNAVSPTEYYCGSAILTKSGKVYTGCNLGTEDALFDICAERTAIVKMFSEGKDVIQKIAVVGGKREELTFTSPCGVCRQLLLDVSPECEVICGYMENGEMKYQSFTAKELLPHGYQMN